MRLFTAVEVGERIQAEAAAVVAELKRRVDRIAPRARVTWVVPSRMHLTLRFIGEVNASRAEQIINLLREPIPAGPFIVRWSGLGAFPKKGPPRVLWVGAGQGTEPLVQVEAAVSARLQRLGIPREDRPYNPHLTLARVREDAGLRAGPLFEGLSAELGETHVGAVTLFESTQSPDGPSYTVLQQTLLRDT